LSNWKSKPVEQERVADRLHSAAIRLLRRLRLHDKASGIGPAQLSALSVLVFAGRPLSLGELAEAEQVKDPTMSRVVAGMIRLGLAKRHVSKEDRRRLVISATTKGTRVLQEGRQRRVRALSEALEGFSPTEVSQLADSAEMILKAVQRIRNP
jgi:DNA-binding MarR family transcriptional regulator